MATKLYNSHLNNIIFNCNEYYILDTYISLVHISTEVNNKYLIQTYSESKSNIISLVRKYVNASYKTIYNCIDKLIASNILSYDSYLNSWTLVDMENMTKSKSGDLEDNITRNDLTGYTHIRNFFFTKEFSNMKAREKRLMIYMAQLADSKSSGFHKGFTMNLLKPNSSWLKVLKTKSKYYAKYTIEKLLSQYNELFINNSQSLREKDLSPKKNRNFKFFFNCDAIKKKNTDNDAFELVKSNNPNEYELIMQKIRFADVTLSKQKIMHLVRSISNIQEWFIKERVVQLIINKYRAIQIHQSRDDIKSLPAYAAAVVRSVLNEFNTFKSSLCFNNIRKYELGEHFIDYTSTNESSNLNSDIILSLAIL